MECCAVCRIFLYRLQADIVFRAIVGDIATTHWPEAAARFELCADHMYKEYGIRPLFASFWNFCLNGVRPGVPRVYCGPHVDFKNIALGICILFVYGMVPCLLLAKLSLTPELQACLTTGRRPGW